MKPISKRTIAREIKKLAKRIEKDHKNSDQGIVFVCILNGSFLFFADLVRDLDMKIEIDFIRVKSYLNREQGDLVITKDLETKIKGKKVFLIDDIADSGNTLKATVPFIQIKEPHSIYTVTLMKRYNSAFTPDYHGIEIEHDEWFYGYGMDLDGFYRNLGEILVVKQ